MNEKTAADYSSLLPDLTLGRKGVLHFLNRHNQGPDPSEGGYN